MRIMLDDMPCDVTATTVGEAIDAAAALAEDRGRLIVDVAVDGRRWTETELASPDRHADIAEVVRLTSARPAELVRQTFTDAAEALLDADGLQREAAELLQSDERTVSLDKLNDAISIWLSVREAIVKGTQLVGLDLDEVTVGDVPIGDTIRRLNERLEVIRSTLGQGDEIGLADTLLYEFPSVVEEWRGVLAELQRRLA